MGVVLVGVFAGKYRRVYNSGSIRCDVGYIVGKGMSFKRNGAKLQAQGARKGEKRGKHRAESMGHRVKRQPIRRSDRSRHGRG